MLYTLAFLMFGGAYLCGDCCQKPGPKDSRCSCQRCGKVELEPETKLEPKAYVLPNRPEANEVIANCKKFDGLVTITFERFSGEYVIRTIECRF